MRLLVQFFDATAGFLPNINTMEEYSMEYPRRSSQEWLDLITDCRTSGMTITAWCKAHSIPKGSYESAVKRLVNQGLLAPSPKRRAASSGRVVCISDPAASAHPGKDFGRTALILEIYGSRLEIMDHAAPEIIRSTLTVLQELC